MTMEFLSSGIPEELKAHACWVGWRYEESKDRPKPTKVPLDPNVWGTVKRASPTDPATWATFDEAEAYAEQHGVGVGFVLSPESGLCCIDLDATNDPAVQGIHRGILEDAKAAGAYIEASPSGKGWHIWLRWSGPKSAPKAIPGVECYTHDHYLTFTGKGRGQVVPMPDSLASRLAPCFAAPATPVVAAPSVELPALSDDEVYDRAAAHYQDAFRALWQGDWERLGIGDGSQSDADFYFAIMLARFTSDPDQWLRLFLQSGMAKTLDRKKTKRHMQQYLQRTYDRARERADSDEAVARWARSLMQPRDIEGEDPDFEYLDSFAEGAPAELKLVDGLLGEGGLSVIYGPPNAGKSFLALDLAFAVASGRPWFGKPTVVGPVLYAAGEAAPGLRKRTKAIIQHKGCAGAPIGILKTALDLPNDWDLLAARLRRMQRDLGQAPALLVIDTVNRFYGDGDENSSKDMRAFLGSVEKVRKEFPALHVLLIHHSGKDADKGMRGSTALLGAIDTAIQCKAEPKHLAWVEKQREGVAHYGLPFKLREVVVDYPDGRELTTCIVEQDTDGKPAPVNKSTSRTVLALRNLDAFAKQSGEPITFQSVVNTALRLREPGEKEGTYNSEKQNVRKALEQLRDDYKAVDYDGGMAATTVITILDRFRGLVIS